MAALLINNWKKSCFCLGFEYELLVSRFEFGESRKIKKIFWPSSIAVFGPTTPKKTHHNTRSWSRLPFMESVNKQGKMVRVLPQYLCVDVRSIRYRFNKWSSPQVAELRLCCGYFQSASRIKHTSVFLSSETKML
jgi:hypothetical protein